MALALRDNAVSRGVALGRLRIVQRDHFQPAETVVEAAQVDDEIVRYRLAVKTAQQQLRQVREKIPRETPSEVREFIDTHALMLDDSTLIEQPEAWIRAQRFAAEWALAKHRDALIAVFDDMEDPYLRARRADVEQVIDRIFQALAAERHDVSDLSETSLAGDILVTDDVAPADLALWRHQGLVGLITEHGGPLSHTAILARSLRLPALVGVQHARQFLMQGEPAIVDGDRGLVIAAAGSGITALYETRQAKHEAARAAAEQKIDAPAVTQDGKRITLQANVELPADVELVREMGADGIGLFRTEFLFMNRAQVPDEAEQYEIYRDVLAAMDGAPVTIRTLDLGADKQLDGGRVARGHVPLNPALGLRAVRLCLRDPKLFRPQVRAILRASAHGPVQMMIPMLTHVQEIFRVKHIVAHAQRDLHRAGLAFDPEMPIGGMIEVPAAAMAIDVFAKYLDFLSIGTNDLIQYTLAIDRVDDEVADLYDPVHPAVVRLLHRIISVANDAGCPTSMCGEMAGDPAYTRLLLLLGLRDFSMHASNVPEIKQIIIDSDLSAVHHLLEPLLSATHPLRIAELQRELNG